MAASPVSSALALLVLLAAAPLVPGIATRTKAIMTGRRGAPVWQLYADLWKLAQRGVVYSTATTWIFRAAPVVVLATTIVAATLLPLDGLSGVMQFSGDAVAFASLLALGRFVLVLGALDTGSSFQGMGASREVTFASLVEPGIFLAFGALGLASHDFSLSTMLGASGARTAVSAPVLLPIAGSVFALALAECSRVPVDDPVTHLELTMVHEVMVLDSSGPDLAMILYASAVKMALFAAIVLDILLPAARPSGGIGVVELLGSLVALGIAIGIVESVMARLRLPKVPLYIAGASAMGLFGLILLLR
jgi:formate hydrogenlyase subunit 4